MPEMDPHFRMAIDDTPMGTKNVVMSISGVFWTRSEMRAFMKEYGRQLIRHAESLEGFLGAKSEGLSTVR